MDALTKIIADSAALLAKQRSLDELKIMHMELVEMPESEARNITKDVVEKEIQIKILSYRKDVERLKEKGDSIVKPYNAPVTNIIKIEGWVLSYVQESNFFNKQKILGISHEDKNAFGEKAFEQDIPYIWEVFGEPRFLFFQNFEHRGHTNLYILGDEK